jgi:hypothetical protein
MFLTGFFVALLDTVPASHERTGTASIGHQFDHGSRRTF